ncbi:MAG: glycosyltransferase [Lachnospiraceae bacterium]|nr:glycosyltransferase [Lachnospiraceae bacterium]
MSVMNIASCLNEAYVPYSYVMLKSLFESNKENDITVYLLHDGLTEKSVKSLFELARSYGQDIELTAVTNFTMDPKIYEYGGWNELTMYRLLLWDILPPKVERVIHLDGDMIVNKDLSKLYEMDFEGNDVIACPDILAAGDRKEFCIQTHGKEFTELFEKGRYFNAGMMVMNVAKNRGKGLMDLYEKTAQKLDYVLPYPDQDLLNYIHKDSVKYVDTMLYNFPTYNGQHMDGGYDEPRARKEVAVLHFLDKKPWSEGDHRFYDIENLWWNICKATPYIDTFKTDRVIAVLGVEEDADVAGTMVRAAEIYKDYFRDFRFVFADACGVGKKVLPEKEALEAAGAPDTKIEYFDGSKKDYDSVADLKSYVGRKISFDEIIFITAGEKIGEPKFFEITDSEAVKEVLWEEGVGTFDRACYGKDVFDELGGFSEELISDEDYEFALRMLRYGYQDSLLIWQEEGVERGIFESTYDTYAFTIGEFASVLKEKNTFDGILTKRLEEAKSFGVDDRFTARLEECIQRKDYKGPILILTGVSECQGALDSFAHEFGFELRRHNQGVIFLGGKEENVEALHRYLLAPLKAVVGFQTKLFGVKLSNGEYVGSVISAPKFNFLFDHPIYLTEEFTKEIPDVHVLSQDETYVKYIQDHLKNIKAAYHFPPAGKAWPKKEEKIYDLTFVGTYNDYRLQEDLMYTLPQNYRDLSKRFYKRQIEEPNKCAEEILDEIFDAMGYEVDEEEYVKTLFAMGYAVKAAMYRFREKVVEALLDGGVVVDVFSDSWKKAPFAKHENLRIHEEVSYEEGLRIMAQSKMSLNVMSWHKGGMTERLCNAMLNKSICVSDETTYIKREFAEEMLLYNLEDFSDLPKRVLELLKDDDKRAAMAKTAYDRAKKTETWSARSKSFIKILKKL